MEQRIIDAVQALRAQLHDLAEPAGQEQKTKAHLIRFLKRHTTLDIDDQGAWFCAVHQEPGARETVAFRADMDALPIDDGAAHLCGHDGHSAVLAGLGLLLEGETFGKNVVLIFQHAEETGAGGPVCCGALQKYGVSRVYAFHNIPGWPEGAVLLRPGTFACASMGLTLRFSGAPTHAAYPENGVNPGFAAAALIAELPRLARQAQAHGLAMATLVGARIGAKAFGTAAGDAEVWLTLRAWHGADMQALRLSVEQAAYGAAQRGGVAFSTAVCDAFPATVNDGAVLDAIAQMCRGAGLPCAKVPEPFRWSEDFGYYGAVAPAAMVGIGAGEDWPQLHTAGYVFNDAIIPNALTLFASLARQS